MASDASLLAGSRAPSSLLPIENAAPRVAMQHLEAAARRVRPSVSRRDALRYERLRDRLHSARLRDPDVGSQNAAVTSVPEATEPAATDGAGDVVMGDDDEAAQGGRTVGLGALGMDE